MQSRPVKPKMEAHTDIRICDYHKKHPGVPYAGCTCSAEWIQTPVFKEELADSIERHGELLNRLDTTEGKGE